MAHSSTTGTACAAAAALITAATLGSLDARSTSIALPSWSARISHLALQAAQLSVNRSGTAHMLVHTETDSARPKSAQLTSHPACSTAVSSLLPGSLQLTHRG